MTQRYKVTTDAVAQSGDAVANASFTVRDIAGDLATLYTGATGATQASNPFTGGDGTPDPTGSAEFWIEPGVYDVTVGVSPGDRTYRAYWLNYPYATADFGGQTDWTVAASGGDFTTLQDAVDFASKFLDDGVAKTITVEDGTYSGGFDLWKDLNDWEIKAETARATLAYSDFTGAATPTWDGTGDDDSATASSNTLFVATRTAVGTMLRGKYSAIIEISSGNGIELRGHRLKRITDILIINTGTGQRGITTGEAVMTGTGGGVELKDCSVHGFNANNIVANYGGEVTSFNSASSLSTSSCSEAAGIACQYSGSTFYVQDVISFGNFQWGARVKQTGMVYSGRGYLCYNRIDGASCIGGGTLNLVDGEARYNGGYGINVTGTSSAVAGSVNASNNLSGGVRAQDNATIACESGTISNNTGIGIYALGGFIRATSATADSNSASAAAAAQGGIIQAEGATLSNSSAGQGARVDGSGFIDAANAIIYGNTNAQSKQVLVSRGGKIDVTGVEDNSSVAITSTETTPALNTTTADGSTVLESVSAATAILLTSGAAAMTNAAGPAMLNEAASTTNPTLIPNKTDLTTGLSRGSGGELVGVSLGNEAFGALGSYFRIGGSALRMGAFPGTQVVGSQQAAIADDASGAANQATVNAIIAALRAHGLIDT